MEDIIARAKEYSRSAGRTGLAHYFVAIESGRRNAILVVASVALSAAVGTSVFSEFAKEWPKLTGMVALIAAALTAVQASWKLGDQCEKHRVSGTRYEALRRQVDMLELIVAGKDIARGAGLLKLDELGGELSKLAAESLTLPSRLYDKAKRTFDKNHPEKILDKNHS
ncbi:MAG TPA: SLATT domain-containing protein [bacterium]|jgi:hypothetical protein